MNMFCIFLRFFRSVLIRNSAISSSGIRGGHFYYFTIAQAASLISLKNIPSINLVSKQIYRQNDGMLLASSKYGMHQLGMESKVTAKYFE